MSNVGIIADLHADMWVGRYDPLSGVDLSDLDALILAGDISNKGHIQWRHALSRLSEKIDLDKVYLLPGNHDYYGGRIDRDDKLDSICEEMGSHFLQKSSLIIGDTRFLCCTLWTDMMAGPGGFEANCFNAKTKMNDYRLIRVENLGFRRLSAQGTANIHQDHKAWLDGALSESFAGRTVVVTHHAPLLEAAGQGAGSILQAYASDMRDFIEKHQPDAWVFGHTHTDFEAVIGACHVKNASLGYPPGLNVDARPWRGPVLFDARSGLCPSLA